MNRKELVAALIVTSLATVACSGSSANTPAPATAANVPENDDEAAGLFEHHRSHHHGGVTLLIAMSLDTLGVTPEQRAAIEKIRTDLHAHMEPARAAEQKLVTMLADGLASGNLDTASVDAAVTQVTTAAAAVHDASADALNALHAALTPPERASLVDKVEANWAVWQTANSHEPDPAKAEHGHLATLTKDLGLTSDQVTKIRSRLDEGLKGVPRLDPQEVANHLKAFGAAFRSEKFDAKALITASPADAHMAGWGAAHLAHFVEAVSPVLSAEQRSKFAQALHEHAQHNPHQGASHEPS